MDLASFYNNKIILVIGGTGSIGSEIVSQLLKFDVKTIRILTNSENELWEKKLKFKGFIHKLRFLLGDVRNLERIKRAAENVDYIFNASAIKHVPIAEYNPMEAVDVNIHGLENIIEAAFYRKVKKLMHISTDKAVNPSSVMGATKMVGERLCISRELAKEAHQTIISCVRFGNVLGSRGSIIPLIKNQIYNGNVVTLTNKKMKRFFMTISDAANLVLKSMFFAKGGEIFVLKMPTIKILDLIEAIIEEYCPIINKEPLSIKIKIIGSRKGEKLDEDLISQVEFPYCCESEEMYIIYPSSEFETLSVQDKVLKNSQKINADEFSGYSTSNQEPIRKREIKELLKNINLI